ncbi:MAG TPA: hypothetical protein V6D17_03980 [Candidatus Obscuribacterales bacterium]
MMIRTALISAVAIAVAAVAVQPANAQGARFKFAPNVYKLEESRVPHGAGMATPQPMHSVRLGAVSGGKSLLGLDPQMLRKPIRHMAPVAPIAQTVVAAKPSFTNVIPQFVPSQFKAQFGQPLSVPAAKAAPTQALPQPAQAQPNALANNAVSGKLTPPAKSAPIKVARAVSGRLKTPRRPVGLAAQPQSIQSYGNQFYRPGTYVPTGSGSSTRTDVYGHIIRKH